MHVTCLHSQRSSGPFFLVLLTLRMKICSFRVPGTNNLVAHHHTPEEQSSNYTAVKTAQLTCKYIDIYSGSSLYIGVCIKRWNCTKIMYIREYFLTRMLYKYSITKSNMTDFQYQPCTTLDSAQRNREESKVMLIRDAERRKK